MSEISIAEILTHGRRALVEDGWCQGTDHQYVEDRVTPVAHCAVGCLQIGTSDVVLQAQARLLLDELLMETGTRLLMGWNDDKSRTKDDVLALFDRGIALAKERGL